MNIPRRRFCTKVVATMHLILSAVHFVAAIFGIAFFACEISIARHMGNDYNDVGTLWFIGIVLAAVPLLAIVEFWTAVILLKTSEKEMDPQVVLAKAQNWLATTACCQILTVSAVAAFFIVEVHNGLIALAILGVSIAFRFIALSVVYAVTHPKVLSKAHWKKYCVL